MYMKLLVNIVYKVSAFKLILGRCGRTNWSKIVDIELYKI